MALPTAGGNSRSFKLSSNISYPCRTKQSNLFQGVQWKQVWRRRIRRVFVRKINDNGENTKEVICDTKSFLKDPCFAHVVFALRTNFWSFNNFDSRIGANNLACFEQWVDSGQLQRVQSAFNGNTFTCVLHPYPDGEVESLFFQKLIVQRKEIPKTPWFISDFLKSMQTESQNSPLFLFTNLILIQGDAVGYNLSVMAMFMFNIFILLLKFFSS